MSDIKTTISTKALAYLNETDDEIGTLTTFPLSIVDFVYEYACNLCNFPSSYNNAKRESILENYTSSIAMACVDVYLRVGTEGQTSYSSNGISRNYKTEWISNSLLDRLPNYVGTL